jgi:hypothetical protein
MRRAFLPLLVIPMFSSVYSAADVKDGCQEQFSSMPGYLPIAPFIGRLL